MIPARDGGGHEDGEALAFPLEGGNPPLGTESHSRTEQPPVELVNSALVILSMLNPCYLCHMQLLAQCMSNLYHRLN